MQIGSTPAITQTTITQKSLVHTDRPVPESAHWAFAQACSDIAGQKTTVHTLIERSMVELIVRRLQVDRSDDTRSSIDDESAGSDGSFEQLASAGAWVEVECATFEAVQAEYPTIRSGWDGRGCG